MTAVRVANAWPRSSSWARAKRASRRMAQRSGHGSRRRATRGSSPWGS